ncbi:MAG: type II secretion system secretin GspD [Deltaproteobacteria bacterium]|nr:type II secretion system secretin GspD [Deltaproteobacteria bacterium]
MSNWFTILASIFISLSTCIPVHAQDASEIVAREADLTALIKVWSKKLGKNFILDERVKGKVTLYLPGDLSDKDSENILDLLLHYKGFASVPVGENIYKIVPLKEAKQGTIKSVDNPSANSSEIVSKVRKLKYANSDDVAKVIQPLLGNDGFLSSITSINSIMMIDSEQNIARLDSLIDSLDVPFAEVELTIIPVSHTDAKEIADRLKELFDIGGESSSLTRLAENVRSRMGSPPPLQPGEGAQPSQGAQPTFLRVGNKENTTKIVADERSNSIIVVADPINTLKIRAVVAQLDSPVNRSGRRYYFYKCKFARAEEIANTLSTLVGQGSAGAGVSGGTARAEEGTRRDSLLLGGRQDSRSRRLGESRLGQDRRQVTGAKLSEDLSITADSSTNSIVIFGTKSEYEKIISLIKQLDVRKKQVLVEATILEVQMLKQYNMDFDFITSLSGKDAGAFAQRGLADLAGIVRNPLSLSGFTAAVAGVGTLKIGENIVIPSQAALVSAAQASQIANVLSAPQILTLDNEEAEILVGQNVPFVVSQSTSETNLDNRFNQIDRQDVGITLRIQPQIASQDLVNLKVFLEVSSVVPGTDAREQGPTTNVRTLETMISAKNGQMIVIGGLITDDASGSTDGIPFLRDVPVLGALFGGSADRKEKRNLLLFITPRILVDQFDLRNETVTRSDRMRATISEIPDSVSRDEVLKNPSMDDVLIFEDFIEPNYPPDLKSRENNHRSHGKISSTNSEGKNEFAKNTESDNLSKSNTVFRLVLSSDCQTSDLPFTVSNKDACITVNSAKVKETLLTSKKIGYVIGSQVCEFSILPDHSNYAGNCYNLTGVELANFGKEPWIFLQ